MTRSTSSIQKRASASALTLVSSPSVNGSGKRARAGSRPLDLEVGGAPAAGTVAGSSALPSETAPLPPAPEAPSVSSASASGGGTLPSLPSGNAVPAGPVPSNSGVAGSQPPFPGIVLGHPVVLPSSSEVSSPPRGSTPSRPSGRQAVLPPQSARPRQSNAAGEQFNPFIYGAGHSAISQPAQSPPGGQPPRGHPPRGFVGLSSPTITETSALTLTSAGVSSAPVLSSSSNSPSAGGGIPRASVVHHRQVGVPPPLVSVNVAGPAASSSSSVGPVHLSPDEVLRAEMHERFARGVHKGTFEELVRFVSKYKDYFNAAMAKEIGAIWADHESLRARSDRTGSLSPADQTGKSSVADAVAAAPDSCFAFHDYDGIARPTETKSAVAISATAKEFNAEILRWRFWRPDGGFSLFCRPSAPFTFVHADFKRWLTEQLIAPFGSRDELMSGPVYGVLFNSLLVVQRLGWLAAPSTLFIALSTLNVGRFLRESCPQLLLAHFYAPGGVMLDRAEAARQFLRDVRNPSFSGHGLIENLFSCLSAVFLCPGLINEFRAQQLDVLYSDSVSAVHHVVVLAQFSRRLSKLVTWLYSDMRAEDGCLVSEPGSSVVLSKLFRERLGVPAWFVRQLADSLKVSPVSQYAVAESSAVAYFDSLSSTVSVSSPTPVPSSVASAPVLARPCIYGFLEKFHPGLNFRCKVPTCTFGHSFDLGESAYVESLREVVEKASAASVLGQQREVVLAALSA
jgi:hypothetical protein